jgi:membrane peptidoglycan carboxypeptidase
LVLKGLLLLGVGMFLLAIIFLICRLVPEINHLRGTGPLGSDLLSIQRFVPLRSFPDDIPRAVLYLEDPDFYSHWGVDPRSIQTALRMNLSQHTLVYGGSSITQQLARTLFLTTEKNLVRKSLELLTAFMLEHFLTKQRILELYLNYIPFGPGVNGFADAAVQLFGESLSTMSIPQKVALLSIMPSPFHFTPRTYQLSPTLERRSKVAHRFYRNYLSPAKNGLLDN